MEIFFLYRNFLEQCGKIHIVLPNQSQNRKIRKGPYGRACDISLMIIRGKLFSYYRSENIMQNPERFDKERSQLSIMLRKFWIFWWWSLYKLDIFLDFKLNISGISAPSHKVYNWKILLEDNTGFLHKFSDFWVGAFRPPPFQLHYNGPSVV